MKKELIAVSSVASIDSPSLFSGTVAVEESPKVSKYLLSIPEKFYVSYDGIHKNSFPKGFQPGFGSGITVKAVNKDGSIDFYMITDRGPNVDGPMYDNLDSKLYLAPSFQPQIAIARFQNGNIEISETIGLTDETGRALTGLPIPPGTLVATNEIALDETFHNLGYDNHGMDSEGIAVDFTGKFWICNEYGPSIVQFDRSGKMLRKYVPGNGLPEVLKYCAPNRGFEGLSIAPNGDVFAAVQSPLNSDGKTSKFAQFTRIIKLDPATGKTNMYAYPIDVDAYKSPKKAKIGGIFAVSNTQLLVIEQGKRRDKKIRNLIYLVDLKNATDITDMKIAGQEPEFIEDEAKLSDIKLANKKLLVDLRSLGWEMEKVEGITMLPDKKTIVVTNDNDFGMTVHVSDSENKNADIEDYVLSADGAFKYEGRPASPTITIIPNSEVERNQYLWMIQLPDVLE